MQDNSMGWKGLLNCERSDFLTLQINSVTDAMYGADDRRLPFIVQLIAKSSYANAHRIRGRL